MTAEALAEHLHARSTGPGRWQGRCPAHEDRSPSLSIAGGRDGRVLLICRAGCPTSAVLAAAGLRWADLYSGPSPSPAALARIQAAREAQQRAELAVRQRERQWRDDYGWTAGVCERAIRGIAPRLIHMPDGADADRLTAELHRLYETRHGYELLLDAR